MASQFQRYGQQVYIACEYVQHSKMNVWLVICSGDEDATL